MMRIDKDRATAAFKAYTDNYDPDDNKIRLKIIHTYHVAELSENIALSIGLDEEKCDLAWLIGLLHDIGRFEQIRQFGTFLDQESIDHADFGADILFKEGRIADYIDLSSDAGKSRSISGDVRRLIETAVRAHNKLNIPDDVSDEERLFCQIIRDADKVDIFRVLVEEKYSEGKGEDPMPDDPRARDEIMDCVRAHRCVPRMTGRNKLEIRISHCCMAFELVYEYSRRMAKEQGYLDRILEKEPDTETARQQMQILRDELEKVYRVISDP